MCFENNFFCFTANVKAGKFNGAPVSRYKWDFGSGDSSTNPNPCHSYKTCGKYTISLFVSDTNGCSDTTSVFNAVEVLCPNRPKFTTTYISNCPQTPVTFKNTTDTAGQWIEWWEWDFGDGNVIRTSDTLWGNPSFIHVYAKDGTFNPKLKMKSGKTGCIDSVVVKNGAKNISYHFDIKQAGTFPNSNCFEKNNICFSQKPRPNAYYWLWQFDDQGSGMENTNDEDWAPCHHFTSPGVYTISLKIWEPNCIRDTTYCAFVSINGPIAKIKMPPAPAFPENNHVHAKPVPPSYWHAMSSMCLNPDSDSIQYVTRTVISKFVTGQEDYYCHSLLDSANFNAFFKKPACPGGLNTIIGWYFPILSSPISTTYFYDSILEIKGSWKPGNPIPAGVQYKTVYFPESGTINLQSMHDTDIFKPDCSGPNYVRFTNNSIKYRGYYAFDDDPQTYFPVYAQRQSPGQHPDIKFDRCYNPSYPWASDSMEYWWDFGDGTAPNCTSTVTHPDINCRWSTEVQPWHLYKNDGCYKVTLSVTDSITKCVSYAQLDIAMEKPVAGWDINAYGLWNGTEAAMNYDKQKMTLPASGNRGLILEGIPCAGNNYPQIPSFNETNPSCSRQYWWMVFDSASTGFGGCGSPNICSDQTKLDFDGDGLKESVQNHSAYTCRWVDQNMFMMMGNKWIYGSGGWKTIGLIIKTGDCYDTFFYHNYKYIADLNYGFNINDPFLYGYIRDASGKLISQQGKYPLMDYNHLQQYRICQNTQAILTVSDKTQEGITSFKFYIDKVYPQNSPDWPMIYMEDSFKTYKSDTIWQLCHIHKWTVDSFTGKKIYTDCFFYPDFTRGKKFVQSEWNDFSMRGYFAKDTCKLLDLADTLFMKQNDAPNTQDIEHEWSLNVPGIYNVSSAIRNVYGCVGGSSARIVVGHYADFEADRQIVCYQGGDDTVVFKHTIRYFWLGMTPFDPDLNPNRYWVDPSNTQGEFDPDFGSRSGLPVPPSVPEKVEWDFGDGTGWHTSPVGADTITWIFKKAKDYSIKLRTTDSNGCVQVLERKDFIKVIGIEADFDTANSPDLCAPQTVDFLDKSFGVNAFTYHYDQSGQVMDSTLMDSAVSWRWWFNDNSGSYGVSYVINPTHTFIHNGLFDIKLVVTNRSGCTDSIIKHSFIKIQGPVPKFWLYKDGQKRYADTICSGDYVTVLDSSVYTTKWQFNKGDKTVQIDTIRPPDHLYRIQYTKAGIFNLTLAATGKVFFPTPAPGHWGECTDEYGYPKLTVVVKENPKASFIASPTSGNRPLKVYFTNTSTVSSGSITGYLWDFGDGSTSVIKDPVHDYALMGGKYTVKLKVTSDLNCTDSVIKYQLVEVISSLEETENRQVSVYPNPADHNLFVDLGKIQGEVIIILTDLYGKELKIVRVMADGKNNLHQLDVSELAKGMYFLHVAGPWGSELYTFVKE